MSSSMVAGGCPDCSTAYRKAAYNFRVKRQAATYSEDVRVLQMIEYDNVFGSGRLAYVGGTATENGENSTCIIAEYHPRAYTMEKRKRRFDRIIVLIGYTHDLPNGDRVWHVNQTATTYRYKLDEAMEEIDRHFSE